MKIAFAVLFMMNIGNIVMDMKLEIYERLVLMEENLKKTQDYDAKNLEELQELKTKNIQLEEHIMMNEDQSASKKYLLATKDDLFATKDDLAGCF